MSINFSFFAVKSGHTTKIPLNLSKGFNILVLEFATKIQFYPMTITSNLSDTVDIFEEKPTILPSGFILSPDLGIELGRGFFRDEQQANLYYTDEEARLWLYADQATQATFESRVWSVFLADSDKMATIQTELNNVVINTLTATNNQPINITLSLQPGYNDLSFKIIFSDERLRSDSVISLRGVKITSVDQTTE